MEPREANEGSSVPSQRMENKLMEIMAARIFKEKLYVLIISKHIAFTYNAGDWGKNRS